MLDPACLSNKGRSLMLLRSFIDELRFNAKCGEITVVKRRPATEEKGCVS
jgi:hypothetical protein